MNAAAPQAPVAETGRIDTARTETARSEPGRTETGRNRKTRHGERPAALEKGAAKGSAEFQELLAARAARMAAAGRSHAADADLAAGAAGLKKALAALLKNQSNAHRLPAPSSQGEPGQVALHPHEDPSRKGSPSRAVAVHGLLLLAALGAPDHAAGAGAASKEHKGPAAEPEKAPVVEVRPGSQRAEPLVRIVDLRRHEKPAAAADASTDRKADATIIADRDSTGASARIGQTRVTIADPSSRPGPAPAAHAAPLDRLRDMAGTELLRASTMVLRDGGGEIRLVLKPESLGSVRVRMNLVDNHIEGRIIVDSAAVKHVFDGSVDALRRALTAEGFQMGSLQVSVGGQDAQADQERRDRQVPETVRRVTAQGFERNVPGAEDVSLGDLFVNLFV